MQMELVGAALAPSCSVSRPRRWSPRCPRPPPPGAFSLHFNMSKGEGNRMKNWSMEPRMPDTLLAFWVLVAVREATIGVCFCPSAHVS
uniref:Uncharacterized protein n=1 Tax=Aegilops tauschii subsp. strangulata TaxID=200361 RepID=A0A453NBY5_AEGTS